MNISMNELKASLSRCFEACGYFVGHYEDATETLLWLEKNGLSGVEELRRALPYLKADIDKPSSHVELEDATSAVIEAYGRSGLNCIASAVDLAQVKALDRGIATVKVRNCHNRRAILKPLTDCAQWGLSVVAYWQNGQQQITEHTAAIKANERRPIYSESVVHKPKHQDEEQALTIICSSRIDLSSSLKAGSSQQTFLPEDMELHYKNTIHNGIQIPEGLWAEINALGSEMLVPSNTRSRLGAG